MTTENSCFYHFKKKKVKKKKEGGLNKRQGNKREVKWTQKCNREKYKIDKKENWKKIGKNPTKATKILFDCWVQIANVEQKFLCG